MSKKSHRKTTKLAGPTHRHDFPIPIDFLTACIPVVLSYLFAYSHNLIHFYISSHPVPPYRPQAPKNPTPNQARPAFSAPQMSAPRHPNRFPEPASGTAPAPPACMRIPLQPWLYQRWYERASIMSATALAYRIRFGSRPWYGCHCTAISPWHGRPCTAMVISLHADPHVPGHAPAETSGRSPQIPNRFRHASSLGRRGRLWRIYTPTQLTQVPCADEGGMGVRVRRRFAMRRRRRCDVDDSGASTCMCDRAIGPRGPITVKPKGLTGLRARRYGPPEGGLRVQLYSLSSICLPTNGYGRSGIEYGLCLNHTSNIKPACQQTGTIIKPVTGSHFWSTTCLPVEPQARLYVGLEARQQQTGTCINVNDGTARIADQSAIRSRRKICGGRPAGLVENGANGLTWTGLAWSSLA